MQWVQSSRFGSSLSADLVGHWKFESDESDSHGSNNGTDDGVVSYTTPAKLGTNSAYFNGSATLTLPIVMGAVGSWNMWYKRADTGTNNSSMFGSTKIGTSDYIRMNPFGSGTGVIQFICQDDVKNYSYTPDTNWHMLTIVWDASTAWKGYLDGSNVVTGTAVKNPTNTSYNVRLGITSDGTGTYTIGQTYYFGSVDSVSYWTRRISESEITELYNSGSGKDYPF